METKHWIFLVGVLCAFPISLAAACAWQRARDIQVLLLIVFTTMTGAVDVNLIGRELYRAATRGIELSLIDVLAVSILIGSLVARRPGVRRWIWPTSLLPMLLYAVYCVGSVLTHEPKIFGVFELAKVMRGLVVFTAFATYVRGPRELRVVIAGIALAMYREGYLALQARYVFGMHRIQGSMEHPNNLSIYATTCAPILGAIALSDAGRWLRLLCAGGFVLSAGCVVLTISRTGFAVLVASSALLGLAVVPRQLWKLLSPKRVAFALLVIAAAVGVTIKASDSLMSRYSQASLADEFGPEGEGRGEYWRLGAMVLEDHPFGVGLNNWSWVVTSDYYPRIGRPSSPYADTDVTMMEGKNRNEMVYEIAPPAHSLIVLTAGELGYAGALIFGCVWFCWLWVGAGFTWRRPPDLISRFGLGAMIGLLACMLGNLTEYAYRHAQIFYIMQVLMGTLVAVAAVRPRVALFVGTSRRHRPAAAREEAPSSSAR